VERLGSSAGAIPARQLVAPAGSDRSGFVSGLRRLAEGASLVSHDLVSLVLDVKVILTLRAPLKTGEE
jgi:hypothetical protein